jgi:hypothetical protein
MHKALGLIPQTTKEEVPRETGKEVEKQKKEGVISGKASWRVTPA